MTSEPSIPSTVETSHTPCGRPFHSLCSGAALAGTVVAIGIHLLLTALGVGAGLAIFRRGLATPAPTAAIRQREILQLIAEGQNTKQIGGILKVSPKTVEYHRMKLMAGLNLHDCPALVRFALGAGLIPPGS